MNRDDYSKNLEKLLSENKELFDTFSNEISNTEIGNLTRTFEEKYEMEKNQASVNSFNSLPDVIKESYGLGVFTKYGELVIDFINNLAVKEKRGEIIFRKDEILNHNKWIERIHKLKDGDFWVYIHYCLFDTVKMMHDFKVETLRKKREEEIENDEKKRKEHEESSHNIFMENFIEENLNFINLFINDIKKREKEKDYLGLSDKTLFNTEVLSFVNKLYKNKGYTSLNDIAGYYDDFEDDFVNRLRKMYQNKGSIITKETHPEIFEQRTKAFKEAYSKDPNYGFEEGYVPTEKEREEHGVPLSKKFVTLIPTEGKSKEQIKKEVKDQLREKGLLNK